MNSDGKTSLNTQPQRTQMYTFDSFHGNIFHDKFSLNGLLRNFPSRLFYLFLNEAQMANIWPYMWLKVKCKTSQIIPAHYKRI